MHRIVLLSIIMAAAGLGAAESGAAHTLAADLVADCAERSSQGGAFCRRLAAGLRSGEVSIEAGIALLRLARETGAVVLPNAPGATTPTTAAAAAPAELNQEQRARAAARLEQMLEGMPPAMAQEQRDDGAVDAQQATPVDRPEPAAPAQPLAADAPVNVPVLSTAQQGEGEGEEQFTYVVIGRGAEHGMSPDHRLYLLRGDEAVVELHPVDVRADATVAMVIDAAWAESVVPSQREVAVGETVRISAPAE
ncbi:MAG: hypothetical protein ACOCZK_01180 [Planctomycetota bacterium]